MENIPQRRPSKNYCARKACARRADGASAARNTCNFGTVPSIIHIGTAELTPYESSSFITFQRLPVFKKVIAHFKARISKTRTRNFAGLITVSQTFSDAEIAFSLVPDPHQSNAGQQLSCPCGTNFKGERFNCKIYVPGWLSYSLKKSIGKSDLVGSRRRLL